MDCPFLEVDTEFAVAQNTGENVVTSNQIFHDDKQDPPVVAVVESMEDEFNNQTINGHQDKKEESSATLTTMEQEDDQNSSSSSSSSSSSTSSSSGESDDEDEETPDVVVESPQEIPNGQLENGDGKGPNVQGNLVSMSSNLEKSEEERSESGQTGSSSNSQDTTSSQGDSGYSPQYDDMYVSDSPSESESPELSIKLSNIVTLSTTLTEKLNIITRMVNTDKDFPSQHPIRERLRSLNESVKYVALKDNERKKLVQGMKLVGGYDDEPYGYHNGVDKTLQKLLNDVDTLSEDYKEIIEKKLNKLHRQK